jgi:hypothetical protein
MTGKTRTKTPIIDPDNLPEDMAEGVKLFHRARALKGRCDQIHSQLMDRTKGVLPCTRAQMAKLSAANMSDVKQLIKLGDVKKDAEDIVAKSKCILAAIGGCAMENYSEKASDVTDLEQKTVALLKRFSDAYDTAKVWLQEAESDRKRRNMTNNWRVERLRKMIERRGMSNLHRILRQALGSVGWLAGGFCLIHFTVRATSMHVMLTFHVSSTKH